MGSDGCHVENVRAGKCVEVRAGKDQQPKKKLGRTVHREGRAAIVDFRQRNVNAEQTHWLPGHSPRTQLVRARFEAAWRDADTELRLEGL